MSAEDLERYETEIELQLYEEYRDVVGMFSYVVETERRFYLANAVEMNLRSEDGRTYFDHHHSAADTYSCYAGASAYFYIVRRLWT